MISRRRNQACISSHLEPTRLPEGVWGHWLMPDVDHLIALMRQAVDDQDLAQARPPGRADARAAKIHLDESS